jgi:hypothetical protein
MSHEDAMLKDITATPVGGQGINLGDPIFPLTPPLNEQDPNRLVGSGNNFPYPRSVLIYNRTIRPSKSVRRPTLQLSPTQPQVKQDSEFFPPLPVKEPLRPRSKDGSESRNPRDQQRWKVLLPVRQWRQALQPPTNYPEVCLPVSRILPCMCLKLRRLIPRAASTWIPT